MTQDSCSHDDDPDYDSAYYTKASGAELSSGGNSTSHQLTFPDKVTFPKILENPYYDTNDAVQEENTTMAASKSNIQNATVKIVQNPYYGVDE